MKKEFVTYNHNKTKNQMKVSELIQKLQDLQSQHGDIPVRTTKDHEYWSTYAVEILDEDVYFDQKSTTSMDRVVREEEDKPIPAIIIKAHTW